MSLTGKTIGELTKLSAITETTLFPVEFSGETFHIPYSSITTNIKPYKVYTALLTQEGGSAPQAIVLENTIGELSWAYRGTGIYSVELIDAFTVDKTAFFISGLDGASGNDGGSPLGPGTSLTWASTGRLNLYVVDPSNNPSNDSLYKYPIEIRVYN